MRLRYFDSGAEGGAREPRTSAIVFANGLGGPISAFRPYVLALAEHHRVVSWDYRGLYGSALPSGTGADLGVPTHARDVTCVLDAAGIEDVTFVGWSMGVPIALEVFRRDPSRVRGLVLMSGTSGRPLQGVALPFSEAFLASIVKKAGGFATLGTRVLERVSQIPSSALWLKRLGFVSHSFDSSLFHEMLDDFKTLDLEHYFSLLDRVCSHDADDVLATIDVPTLVISGARDRLTPAWASRRMSERIRGAEFFLVPGATHYAAAEFPELLAARIQRFVHERIRASPHPP